MFNLGGGEIVVLVVLGIIFLGPKKLPELGADLGALVRERMSSVPSAPRWSWSEWILVIAALVSGAAALALLTGPRP